MMDGSVPFAVADGPASMELERLPLRTLLKLGETAVIELTGLRTPFVLIDRFRAGLNGPDRQDRSEVQVWHSRHSSD